MRVMSKRAWSIDKMLWSYGIGMKWYNPTTHTTIGHVLFVWNGNIKWRCLIHRCGKQTIMIHIDYPRCWLQHPYHLITQDADCSSLKAAYNLWFMWIISFLSRNIIILLSIHWFWHHFSRHWLHPCVNVIIYMNQKFMYLVHVNYPILVTEYRLRI